MLNVSLPTPPFSVIGASRGVAAPVTVNVSLPARPLTTSEVTGSIVTVGEPEIATVATVPEVVVTTMTFAADDPLTIATAVPPAVAAPFTVIPVTPTRPTGETLNVSLPPTPFRTTGPKLLNVTGAWSLTKAVLPPPVL